MLLAQIEISYTDGTKDVVSTGASWRFTYGPVRESVWLGGEDYDANYEIDNSTLNTWDSAVLVPESDYPFERIEAKMSPSLKPVFNMLSEYGYSDCSYKMIMNPAAPGYLYFVSQGKTTLPEEWNGGASQDHCMAGHGEGWLFEYLGGIRNDGIAYKNSIIAPYIADELTSFDASVKPAHGFIVSSWSKTEEETAINVTIPANTASKIYFPTITPSKIYENGVALSETEGVTAVYMENGSVVAEVGSGSYSFVMPTEKPLSDAKVKLAPGISASENENMFCAMADDFVNIISPEAINAEAIFSSLSDDGSLDKVKTVSISLGAGVNVVQAPDEFNGEKFSVMLWSSLNEMKPLCLKTEKQ